MQATCSKLHSAQYRAIIITPSTCLSLQRKSSVFSVRYELNCYIMIEIPDVIKFRQKVKGNPQFWYSNCSRHFFSRTIKHSSHFQSILRLCLAFGLLYQNEDLAIYPFFFSFFDDLPCSLKFVFYPVVCSLAVSSGLIIAICPVVWRLRAVLWFDYCDLSCGLKIARYPVVCRLRTILWFEDCALSWGLKIVRYFVVWRLRAILWFADCDQSCGLKIARYRLVWRLRSVLWFEYCDLSCGFEIAHYPVVCRLRAILWSEDCALSCSLIIAIWPVVWRLRAFLWFEDHALSCGLKIAPYPVVWRLPSVLWCHESGLWNVPKKKGTILCLTCRIRLILISRAPPTQTTPSMRPGRSTPRL